MRVTWSSAFILVLLTRAGAQEQPTFSADVKVVSLLATVHDKDGRIVKNLNQDDFTLLENGVPQKIRYFSREAGLPLTIGLLVDTSRSQTGVLEKERRASFTFLDRVLEEDKDQAFVAHFDTRVEILQGLTSSRAELTAALGRLRIPGDYATLIFSAIRECSEQVMRKQTGRKAFILLTDGVAFRDHTSIGTAIEFAQRADTIIYSIRFSDPIRFYRPVRAAVQGAASERGKQGLARMAKETGGVLYEVSKGRTLEEIYAQIEEALRNQYSIGYTPDLQGDGSYRKIKLTTKDRSLVVDTRDGYYAK
jgi:VWFA-related protein